MICGALDDVCNYEGNAVRTFAYLGTEERYLTVINGTHGVFSDRPVSQHSATAFLGYYLQGDESYRYLTENTCLTWVISSAWGPYEDGSLRLEVSARPGCGRVPGITYQAQSFLSTAWASTGCTQRSPDVVRSERNMQPELPQNAVIQLDSVRMDAVWDRGHALINHFATAFLLAR